MDALVKAVDFEAAANATDIAELLIEETLRDPGAVEIGYVEGNRWTVGLEDRPANDGRPVSRSTKIPSFSLQARREVSSRRLPPIWPRRPGPPSICWT